MWTNENRARYDRNQLRDPSGLTDAEFALIKPIIPPAKRGGNRRHASIGEAVNGLMDILSAGCQWRAIPKDLPPRSAPHDYFDLWSRDGTLDRIHHALYVKCREQALREPSPAAAVIDRKTREKRGKRGARIGPAGYDAGNKIKGKKRHVLVATQGLLMEAIAHGAGIQDRDRGALLMASLFGLYPLLLKLYAGGGCRGPEFQRAPKKALARVRIEIVKRRDEAKAFVVLPKRWIAERTFAWLGRCRRLAKDFETLNRKARAFLRLASIRLMLRKLCNPA